MEIDFTIVDDDCLLDEGQVHEDEPLWLPELRRSINRLQHSLAALHRKVGMSDTGDSLTAAIEALNQKEATLEGGVVAIATGVKDSATAFTALEAHIDELVAGQALSPEQATALRGKAEAVGAGLDNATTALTAAAGELSSAAKAGEAAAGAGAGAGGGGGAAEPTLYNFTGDPSQIDSTKYTKDAATQGQGGVALYTFNEDVAGEAPKGAPEGSGWAVWTQPTEAVPAA